MTATDLYIKKDGTISIANGDATVTGTGTTWGGIDRQGSLLISGGVIVGVVAALDDGEEYGDLSLPLVDAYDGTTLSGADYVLLPPPSIFKGATQAAIYAYFNTFFRQNAGLFFKKSDIIDWSIVPNNSLVLDEASKTLFVWRDGVLDPVYAVGAPFSPAGAWNGGTGTALSISTGQTAVNFASDANRFTLTVNANTEIQLPTNVTVGDQRDILFTGDGTHSATWAAGFLGTDVVRSASGKRTRMRLTINGASGGTATAVSYAMVAFDENQWVSDGGDFWVSTLDGNTSEPGTNTDWAEMPTSAGPAGADGTPGTNGVPLTWDTSTTDANPGSGKVRANNASIASANKLFISKTSAAGSDIAAWLAAADDSTNPTIKATVVLTRWSDGKQAIVTLSAITDATGYVKADIAYVSGQTSFTAADDLGLNIERVGNKGADGSDGTDGSDGAPGSDGSDGADGTDPGILLTWDDGNTDADPGSGKLRADNDDLSAATTLYVSKNNRAGDDIAAFLAGLDDSTNPTAKAKIVLTRSGGNAQATFDLTGVTDASGYVKLAVSNFAGATGFVAADAISLQAYPVGNAGANGAGAGTVTNAAAIGANEIVIGDDGADGVKGSGKTHSTDGTLAGNSDAKVPTEKAVKTYADTKLAKAGGTMTGDLTLAADPTSNLHAATKQYVDGLLANLGKRARVRAATTANVTISTALNNGDSLDGVTLVTGDLVLVKNQSSAAENGVYVVGASPSRDAQFDIYDEHPGSLIAVEEGSTNADTLWLCTSNVGGTLGTTAIAFSKMVIAGELLAANNLSDVANAGTARGNLGLAIGSNVQAWDADLDALAGVSAAGMLARTGAGSVAARTITGTANKIVVTNGDGVSGGPALNVGSSVALLDSAGQSLSGGARVVTYDNGTKSSGTFTPDPGNGPNQKAGNNGAHTLAPGTNYGSYFLDYTNGASAGAITTSGFTKVSGDSFTTTSGNKFSCHIKISEIGSTLNVQAMQ